MAFRLVHIMLVSFLFMPLLSFGQTAPDFSAFKDVKEKKKHFFEFFYPLIEQANHAILADRQFLQTIKKSSANAKQTERLDGLCERYKVTCGQPSTLTNLLARVDVVPASLTLAQAANESAWGTSRFATQANNFFGVWCFKPGCGLVPKHRSKGSQHQVRVYPTPLESVQGYMYNLNVSRAYKKLRSIRAALRANGNAISGVALAAGLNKYSERGNAYVKEIRHMIRYNKLNTYDKKLYSALGF